MSRFCICVKCQLISKRKFNEKYLREIRSMQSIRPSLINSGVEDITRNSETLATKESKCINFVENMNSNSIYYWL